MGQIPAAVPAVRRRAEPAPERSPGTRLPRLPSPARRPRLLRKEIRMVPAADLPEARSSKRGAVLCVDDEPQVLSALQRTLRHEPYEVVTAADPELALDCLDRLPVEVVIADERMPRMNGSDLLEEVHRRWP